MSHFRSFLQWRPFSTQPSRQFPLQPAKQRKTTPFRLPKRPLLPDPIDTDPTAQKFKLREHPQAVFVIREPNSMPNLEDRLLGSKRDFGSLSKPPGNSQASQPGLSHPVLAVQPMSPPVEHLPPPVRLAKTFPNSLTPEILKKIRALRHTSSLSQLSKKFGVSRFAIEMLGVENQASRAMIGLRNDMRQQRRENRWSVAKLVRREEKRTRRSMW